MKQGKSTSRIARRVSGGLLAILLLMTAFEISAQNVQYNLRAAPKVLTMPDGTGVTMWGFALVSYDLGAGPVTVDGEVTVPGPRLTVPEGRGLTVTLVNETPEPVSIMIPGQPMPLAEGFMAPQVARNPENGRIRSFVHETPAATDGAAGGPVSYSWNTIRPGTYLYHSGTHPAVQVQMGLYGAVVKNDLDPAGEAPARAYPGVPYDAEALLLYSEIDPALHTAVAAGYYGTVSYPSTIEYHPKYFLLNGEAGDMGAALLSTVTGKRVLVRFLNAGLLDHAPQILDAYLTILAEDGNPYPFFRERFALLLPAGKTLDAILDPGSVGEYPIYDRRLFRSNAPGVRGAMQAVIEFTPVVPPEEPPAEP